MADRMLVEGAHARQKDAESEARLCRRDQGLRGWEINTWENLGWHWELIAPCSVKVRLGPNNYSNRYAYKMDVHWSVNAGVANFWLDGNNPRAMLERAKRMIRAKMTVLAAMQRAVERLEIP